MAACLGGAAPPFVSSVSFAQQPGARQAPPPAVVVEKIEVQQVSNPAQFTGRVEAIEAVDIRARVTGFLHSVDFKDGQAVKAGDTLFEIEPDQLNALVASARAQVARADATRISAERSLARNRDLLARRTVSQATVDEVQAAFDVASADVQVAQAALDTAELNLSYAHITAPISGSIGRATFTTGNLVGPDSGSLARIVSLDTVRVAFAVTEGLLVTIRQQQASGGGLDPNTLKLSLRLANGTDYGTPGRIEFIENEIDPQTGTVAARAVFPNPRHILLPGQFVTLYVQEKDAPSLPVVPQTAVLQDREGRFVYLLGKDNIVSQQRIHTGARVGNGWAVTKGLDGGEQVVVEGIQRLAQGMTVQPSQGQPVGGGT
ncbi:MULTISPECIES: efflux RND transporter periplasmic adaptor subunit [Mesorhizobium]|nr:MULTISPECIES: efflux RND transporter periplasmic adaptor subunit [Mesorhizobium]ETA71365.1 RND family efflux transporter, MFP subunit [Mesorhizobium japonicum R7A]MBE1711763.1 efflux RND transporter periplasmic adaptor subunit [Mesorhizobium japonicum]MBE1717685.1 efflux RND transporter periplasmic adaptor subunit [Mesorhizobium japonicum]MUT23592.1 efflux RND transporter periplasmic adaptor subunit [Mesorhizobium japonicum]MUT30384.1 efflux RND transporter periplasmic adaptor subunit [Meso